MGFDGELGEVKDGYLAVLLLADVSVMQHRANMSMIMKDGVIYKGPRTSVRGQQGLIANH